MKVLLFPLTLIGIFLFGCSQPCVDQNATADAGILGRWSCESAIVDGSSLPDDIVRELRLVLTEDRFKTLEGDEILFDSTYKLDTMFEPQHIDMLGNEGDLTGKDAFDSQAGYQAFFIVWKQSVP